MAGNIKTTTHYLLLRDASVLTDAPVTLKHILPDICSVFMFQAHSFSIYPPTAHLGWLYDAWCLALIKYMLVLLNSALACHSRCFSLNKMKPFDSLVLCVQGCCSWGPLPEAGAQESISNQVRGIRQMDKLIGFIDLYVRQIQKQVGQFDRIVFFNVLAWMCRNRLWNRCMLRNLFKKTKQKTTVCSCDVCISFIIKEASHQLS